MKVVILTHYSTLYGANSSMLDFISGARKYGIKFLVVSAETGPLDSELAELGVPVIHIKMYRLFYTNAVTWMKAVLKCIVQPVIVNRALKRIASFEPDIIYSNSSVLTLGNSLSRKLAIPHVWHVREFRVADYSMYYLFGESRLKRLLNQADRIVSISDSISKSLLPEVNRRKIVKIYNGVMSGQEAKNFRSRILRPDRRVCFGMVGVIRKSKGQLDATLGILKLRDEYGIKANLIIYGDVIESDYFEMIQRLIKENKLEDQVCFKGFEKDKEIIYHSFDILLVCSVKEAFGRVTTEAMFRGIPVIGRNSGGTSEIISDGISGFLYEQTETLVLRMKEFCTNSDLYAELSVASRDRAMKNFSREAYVDQLNSLFQGL